MYNNSAMEEVEKLLGGYFYREINELRYDVARYGIHASIQGKKVRDICKKIVGISHYSLIMQGYNEEHFLDPIIELLDKNKMPVDL